MLKIKNIAARLTFLTHPLAFAIFPVLSLFTYNIQEVPFLVLFRPLLISVTAASLLLLLFRLLLKNWFRSALVTTLICILFYSYGHVYYLLRSIPVLSLLIRHRYLGILYGLLLAAGLWWLIWKLKDTLSLTRILNVIGLVLLVYPTFTTVSYLVNLEVSKKVSQQTGSPQTALGSVAKDDLPDIYYIILDSYTRSDALKTDLGLDTTAFIDELRQMGFYVADCSRSNYRFTQGSLTSSLNMDYLTVLVDYARSKGLDQSQIWDLLKYSKVREQLEAAGYKTVAFKTGYQWSNINDASIYLTPVNTSALLGSLNPFEAMLIKDSAGLLLSSSTNKLLRDKFYQVNFPLNDHVNLERFILDELPKIHKIFGPKFVFVHLLIPHVPFVFDKNGDILTDPNYYSGNRFWPETDEYMVKGYVGQVAYLDKVMPGILKSIIANSSKPPIIILQGDHGLINANRVQILNAYYFPGGGQANLYPTITPVNSFRVLFNFYFGTNYPLLPDQTFLKDGLTEIIPAPEDVCPTQ
jgi:hypothetical protein